MYLPTRPQADRARLLAIIFLLLLPTALIAWHLLGQLNAYVGILQDEAGINSGTRLSGSAARQALALAAGMFVAAWFHSFRFRFLPFYGLLIGFISLAYSALDSFAAGEFDFFFISVQFLTYSVLFCVGWLLGWGFVRWRNWAFITALIILVVALFATAKLPAETFSVFTRNLFFPVLYAIYLLFTAEQIYQYAGKGDPRFWRSMARRLGFFLLLMSALSFLVFGLFQKNLKATYADWGASSKNGGDKGMTSTDSAGNHSMKQSTSLSGALKRNNELVFAAHIDNYFPDSDFPNPLYLTTFYYTLFDSTTETFERDMKLPAGDLFCPEVSRVPLFKTLTDTAVYRKASRYNMLKEVEVEIYSKKLAPNEFYAPLTAYQLQPVTVDKGFRNEFNRAYRTRSVISELNSAYFVYNAGDNAEIAAFQEQRFEVLRKASNTDDLPAADLQYYTRMPAAEKWEPIRQLAAKITAGQKYRIDKVLAIRDYFLSKDSTGQPLFRYSDNPGIPDIPSASRLLYFLFENRQGYCAYYAGATLFMLRSLGIPSRIAAGYLTTDRSGGKNKGWYWYYADQAHAWVQVYFPGYGWLDFDTTVSNDDAQESPQPDGTPPVQPPKAVFAAEGICLSTDTLKKQLALKAASVTHHDTDLPAMTHKQLLIDASRATLLQDSLTLSLSALHVGDTITAVSYDKNFRFSFNDEPTTALRVDEIYVRPKRDAATQKQAGAAAASKPWSLLQKALLALGVAAVLLLIYLSIPWLILQYYQHQMKRAGSAKEKVFRAFRLSAYHLHMSGYPRGEDQSPSAYARQMDGVLKSNTFSSFIPVFQKARFSQVPLTAAEGQVAERLYPQIAQQLKPTIPRKTYLRRWLRPMAAISEALRGV